MEDYFEMDKIYFTFIEKIYISTKNLKLEGKNTKIILQRHITENLVYTFRNRLYHLCNIEKCCS